MILRRGSCRPEQDIKYLGHINTQNQKLFSADWDEGDILKRLVDDDDDDNLIIQYIPFYIPFWSHNKTWFNTFHLNSSFVQF